MRILVAEDKEDIANLVKIYLEKEQYEVVLAENGQVALDLFNSSAFDLCIFDIMMPIMNGLSLIQKIRESSNIPILVLSARSLEQDRILGLDLGADDYITKPFSSLELVSRVNAHIRRNYGYNTPKNFIEYGKIKIDTDKYKVTVDGVECHLTATEYKILVKLISSPEIVFTKKQLFQTISEHYTPSDGNTISVHISRLRDKIEPSTKSPKYIKTIRGLGYKIEKK